MKEKITAIAKALKEGATASQLKYKELNNEATKVQLSESKISIEEMKKELNKQRDIVAMIEKEMSYHEMMLRHNLAEKERLDAEKHNENKFLEVMAQLDNVNKDIDYRHAKIAELSGEYKTENEVLAKMKEDLITDQQTHKDKLNRLIHNEEKLASEMEKRRTMALTN